LPRLLLACGAVNGASVYFLYQLRGSDRRRQSWLDVLLPFAVLFFAVGLVWGLQSDLLIPSLKRLSERVLGQPTSQIRIILAFGVPAVLCYTFVERSLRFGLSVAAVLVASAFTSTFDENTIYQERSFFGVLRVERQRSNYAEGPSHRLVHGTTLHGRQYLKLADEDYAKYPELIGSDTWP